MLIIFTQDGLMVHVASNSALDLIYNTGGISHTPWQLRLHKQVSNQNLSCKDIVA